MDCTVCRKHSCRTAVTSCGLEKTEKETVLQAYHTIENQQIVQAAAKLVDNGRAVTLSRIEEILEYVHVMGYKKIGFAYCYGMESTAMEVVTLFRSRGLAVSAVSCTVGAMAQSEVNLTSKLPGASCNPINQAEQFNLEKIPFVVAFGLCLGHDMLFQKHFTGDVTTLLVKDRKFGHNPLLGIKELTASL